MRISDWSSDVCSSDLEDAQGAKVDAILDRLDLRSGSRLLEIGCGWGALAERAVERHDVLYTGITLSPAQAEIADARLNAVDLSGRSRIELCDYRDAQGPYDAIARVEMVDRKRVGEGKRVSGR